jgi:predicted PurR-regulated permease PerM
LKGPLGIAVIAVLALATLRLMPVLPQVLLVIFGAVVTAVLLDGVSNAIARHTPAPRWLALTAFVLLCLTVLAGTFWFMGDRVSEHFRELSERIRDTLEQLTVALQATDWGQRLLQSDATDPGILGSAMLGQVGGVFSNAIGAVANALILLVVALYLAANPGFYIHNALRLVPAPRRRRYLEVVTATGSALRWWFVGRFSSMAVVGTLTTVGLWIAQVPMPFVLGLIAGLLSFVPFAGPIIAAIPGILVAWGQDQMTALYAVLVYVLVEALESNLITPLIEQRAVSVAPALLIVGQLLFGTLFGLWGVVWATPLLVVLIVMVRKLYLEDVLHEKHGIA